ncbi:TipC family immunity protein [Aciduricibacillus chroicocephali]|uniref:TipC family immunity protein n=1 Tax=Aciduricibacillus chroicocephali TaxID=3054939 RepID=A0ABY9KWL8_9BACI|nr:TipC family immunity protein [Bacillaceae bacterium 44XB]
MNVDFFSAETNTRTARTRFKKHIMLLATLFILLFLLFRIILSDAFVPKNVFDEMYTAEQKTMNKYTDDGFPNMENIQHWNRKSGMMLGNMAAEDYEETVLEKDEAIRFLFLFDKNRIHITYSKDLKMDVSLNIRYVYDQKSRKLNEYVSIYDENLEEFNTKNRNEIRRYLNRYNIKESKLKQIAHEVLYNRVLLDWFDAYDSKFSVEDLGNVKIEKDSFLK